MSITTIVATMFTADEIAVLVIICLLVAFVVSLALPQAQGENGLDLTREDTLIPIGIINS
jgi:hypothetical protein